MPRALSTAEIQSFRDDLCDCAARLFAERGFGGVTLRALAAELGCSPMTPYRYFASKEEIFDEVRTAGFRRFGMRMEAVSAQHPDPVVRWRAMGREYLAFAVDEPHAYCIMFQLDMPSVEIDEDSDQAREMRRGWLVLQQAALEDVTAGRLVGEPDTLANVAWSMLHGLASLHLAGKLKQERSLDDLVEPILDTFFHGSEARPNAEGPIS